MGLRFPFRSAIREPRGSTGACLKRCLGRWRPIPVRAAAPRNGPPLFSRWHRVPQGVEGLRPRQRERLSALTDGRGHQGGGDPRPLRPAATARAPAFAQFARTPDRRRRIPHEARVEAAHCRRGAGCRHRGAIGRMRLVAERQGDRGRHRDGRAVRDLHAHKPLRTGVPSGLPAAPPCPSRGTVTAGPDTLGFGPVKARSRIMKPPKLGSFFVLRAFSEQEVHDDVHREVCCPTTGRRR